MATFIEEINAAIANLPEAVRGNAEALVAKMSEKIEGIDDEDVNWTPPSLKLVQGTTDRSALPKEVKVGDLVLEGQKYDNDQPVIVLAAWTERRKWDKDDLSNSTADCGSPDAVIGYKYGNCKECVFSKWNEAENKSGGCDQSHKFLVITKDLSKLFYVILSRTAYKNGTDWKQELKRGGIAIHSWAFNMEVSTSAKHRNIEQLKTAGKTRVEPELLPFLATLAGQVRNDRKEYLVQFHKRASESKAETPALENKGGDADTVLLDAPTEEASTEESTESKGYVL